MSEFLLQVVLYLVCLFSVAQLVHLGHYPAAVIGGGLSLLQLFFVIDTARQI